MSQTEFLTRLFRGEERRAPGGEALARRMVAHLSVERGDKVLAIGAGAGVVSRALAREIGCFVTCLDPDETALAALKAAAQKDGVEGLITLVKGDLKTLEVPAVGYSAVVLEGALRFLGLSFEEAASLARRHLGPSGLLAISATARVGRTLPAAVEAFYQQGGTVLRPPVELSHALEQQGFEPLAAEAYADAMLDEWYRYLEGALAGPASPADPGAAAALRREIEIFRREGGRSCVAEILFIARRKEPGEKPPPSRGGE